MTEGNATISYGRKMMNLDEFLYDNAPTIFFADGASLCGTEYIELNTPPAIYDRNRIIQWDWQGVNLGEESQGVAPNLKRKSIQYHVIKNLMGGDFDIIYDDDSAGEIADVITMKHVDNKLNIGLYQNEPHNSKVSYAALRFLCSTKDENSEMHPTWKRPKV